MNTTINFGGFYHSHHEYIIEQAAAYMVDAFDEYGEIDHDKLFDFNDWDSVQVEYCKEWLNMLNSELGTNINFVALDSPKFYNYSTDVIIADISEDDYKAIMRFISDNGLVPDVDKRFIDATTTRSGYAPFYTYSELMNKPSLKAQIRLDSIIEYLGESYPFICEDFYY